MNHAYTLADLATIEERRRQNEPRMTIERTFLFSFEVKPNADKHAVYLAAIDEMNAVEYEPREYACIKATLRYPSIVVRGALKVSLDYYKCVKAGLQAAMGDDVQIQLVWRGDTGLTDGAVVEVEEVN